jgi:hypothetical protein
MSQGAIASQKSFCSEGVILDKLERIVSTALSLARSRGTSPVGRAPGLRPATAEHAAFPSSIQRH